MRRLLGSLIDHLCRARDKRRLARYGVTGPGVALDQLTLSLFGVPGMMSPEAGPMLFILAATQQLVGDIIEIGSWQGRSTIFLARGTRAGLNGRVYAVDHFLGNPGKEYLYRVSRDDLSDLTDNFNRNVAAFGVCESVELLPVDSARAATILSGRGIRARMLFIDGNHDYESVHADFQAFRGLLLPQALVVFDDYSASFPGVIQCVQELVDSGVLSPRFNYGNCFVAAVAGS